MSKKITMSLEETLKVMDMRHQAERDREITKVCSKDLRRWILIGNFLREKRSEKIKEIEVAILADPEFDSFIKLDIDRELFVLGPRKKEEKNKTKTDVKSSVPQSESSTATANEGASIATETTAMPEVVTTPATETVSAEATSNSETKNMIAYADRRYKLVYLQHKVAENQKTTVANTFSNLFGGESYGTWWGYNNETHKICFVYSDSQDVSSLRAWLPDRIVGEDKLPFEEIEGEEVTFEDINQKQIFGQGKKVPLLIKKQLGSKGQ